MDRARSLLSAACALALSACGSNGSDDPDPGTLTLTVTCPGAGGAAVPSDDVTVAFFASGGAPALDAGTGYTFTCALDGDDRPCGTGYRFEDVASGSHTITVTVTDAVAGSGADASAAMSVSRTCEIDVIAVGPAVIAQLVPSDDGAIPASGQIEFAARGGSANVRFDCTVNGVMTTDCHSPLAWTGLANGATLDVTIVATNELTNGIGPATHLVGTVDLTGPTLDIVAPTASTVVGMTNPNMARFESDGETIECDVDGNSFNCAAGVDEDIGSIDGGDGAHTLTVVARDALGNATTRTVTFHVDGKGPAPVTFVRTPGVADVCPASTGSTEILLQAFDAAPFAATAVTFRCYIDGIESTCASTSANTATLPWTGLATGTRNIRVVAIDRFGNQGPVNMDQSIGITTTMDVVACP